MKKVKVKVTDELIEQLPELEQVGAEPGDTIEITVEGEDDDEGDRPPKPPHNG